MQIIKATEMDVPRIMECAREFTELLDGCTLNEFHYGASWQKFLKNGTGAIFLLVEGGRVLGGIGGVYHPDILTAELVAVELFWYVKPEHRKGLWPIRLHKEYERWARDNGCAFVSMIYMEDSMPEKMDEYYEKRGYRKYETVFRKRLKP